MHPYDSLCTTFDNIPPVDSKLVDVVCIHMIHCTTFNNILSVDSKLDVCIHMIHCTTFNNIPPVNSERVCTWAC